MYRWHSTFAHSCREIAERVDPGRVRQIHRRTAKWLAGTYPSESVYHALQTGDDDFAVAMINEVWLPLVMHGRSDLLEEWCLQLPSDRQTDASILYIRSVCRINAGDTITSQLVRTYADAALERMSGEALMKSTATMIFTSLLPQSGHAELSNAVDEAEGILAETSLSRGQYLHYMYTVGSAMVRLRIKPLRAIELLSAATSGARELGLTRLERRASTMNALALAFVGKFTAAREILDRVSASSGTDVFDPIDGSNFYWSSMFVSYWQGDVDRLIADARVLDANPNKPTWRIGLAGLYFAATATIARHDLLDEALGMLEKVGDTVEHGLPWPAYKAIAHAGILWARGKRPAAVQALERIGSHDGITTVLSMAADLWRRLGYPEQALRVISKIEPQLLVSYTIASIRFTEAVIAWDHGNSNRAHQLLESCLSAAVPESVCAPFLRLDDSARDLLKDHLNRGTPHAQFVAERLSEDSRVTSRPDSAPESLSAREAEVFNYLATTMTATEIADALFVSPATVRTHQRSIYRKLGVKSRREAVRAGLRDGT